MKSKTGQYIFKMEIPVTVLYSKRKDNPVSIDSVFIPTQDDIYIIVDKNAEAIKASAQLRS